MKKYPSTIPHFVWPADWLRRNEAEAADSLGISLYELMLRAGEAAFRVALQQYPDARHYLILCGQGNNGGDGYVVARLAQAQGIQVTLLAVETDKAWPEEAARARQAWLDAGGKIQAQDTPLPPDSDLIIDSLLGTGLRTAPRSHLAELIDFINLHPAPVIALDIPSGLLAETGATPGTVVKAAHSVTFITLKPGLLTGKARDVVGQLHYDALGLEPWLKLQTAPYQRYDEHHLSD